MLGVPANGIMVYLAYLPSRYAVAVHERIGTTRPIHCSALGKAYLSALDGATLDLELGRLSYTGGTDRAAKGPLDLRTRVDAARSRGYAIDREETFAGGSCVAAPATIGGVLIGAIGISGPTSRLNDEVIVQLGTRLCEEIGRLDAFGKFKRSSSPHAAFSARIPEAVLGGTRRREVSFGSRDAWRRAQRGSRPGGGGRTDLVGSPAARLDADRGSPGGQRFVSPLDELHCVRRIFGNHRRSAPRRNCVDEVGN